MKSRSGINLLEDNGLTLIEMTIATGILGFVVIGILSFYLSGLRAWQRSLAFMDEQQSARIAMERIVSDLSRAAYCEIRHSEIEFRFREDDGDIFRRYRLNGREIVLEKGTRRGSNYRVSSHLKIAEGISSLTFSEEDGAVKIIIETEPAGERIKLRSAVRMRNM